MRRDRERIADILESIAAIERHKHRGRESLDGDELLRAFVLYHLQIIGEAARELSPSVRSAHPGTPWPAIIGMRNRLVHGYYKVDPEIVWGTVEDDLPPLRAAAEAILAQPESSEADPADSP